MEAQGFFSLQKEFGNDKHTSCHGVQWREGLKAEHFQSLSYHLWSDRQTCTHTPTDDDRKENSGFWVYFWERGVKEIKRSDLSRWRRLYLSSAAAIPQGLFITQQPTHLPLLCEVWSNTTKSVLSPTPDRGTVCFCLITPTPHTIAPEHSHHWSFD